MRREKQKRISCDLLERNAAGKAITRLRGGEVPFGNKWRSANAGVRLKTNPLDSLVGLIDLHFGTVERRSASPRDDLGSDHTNI